MKIEVIIAFLSAYYEENDLKYYFDKLKRREFRWEKVFELTHLQDRIILSTNAKT